MKHFISFITLLILISIVSCQRKEATDCPIENLVLNKTVFPIGTSEDPIRTPIKDKPTKSASKSLYYHTTMMYQEVIKYSYERRADRIYESDLDTVFPQKSHIGRWEKPNFSFESDIADKIEYACGIMDNQDICRFYARYKTYIIYLQVIVSDEGFSEKDFYRAISFLDTEIERCQ